MHLFFCFGHLPGEKVAGFIELDQKNEIIKSLMEIQSTMFDSLSAGRNGLTISDQ